MKLFRFDPEVGRSIDQHNSSGFRISQIAHLSDEAVINCAYLDAKGWISQATVPQLFLVVQGEGWVRSEAFPKTWIKACQADYWGKEEWHESGTETGMMVIIIEGASIDSANLMPPV